VVEEEVPDDPEEEEVGSGTTRRKGRIRIRTKMEILAEPRKDLGLRKIRRNKFHSYTIVVR
jgi:hypothetical protein